MQNKTKLELELLPIQLRGVFLLSSTNSHFRASTSHPLLNHFFFFFLNSIQYLPPGFGYTIFPSIEHLLIHVMIVPQKAITTKIKKRKEEPTQSLGSPRTGNLGVPRADCFSATAEKSKSLKKWKPCAALQRKPVLSWNLSAITLAICKPPSRVGS